LSFQFWNKENQFSNFHDCRKIELVLFIHQEKQNNNKKKNPSNNRFNLTCPLSRFVQCCFELKRLDSGSTNRANPLRGTGGAG